MHKAQNDYGLLNILVKVCDGKKNSSGGYVPSRSLLVDKASIHVLVAKRTRIIERINIMHAFVRTISERCQWKSVKYWLMYNLWRF